MSHDFKLDIEIYYTVSSDSAANRLSGVKKPLRRTASGPEAPRFILAGHTQLTVDHLNDRVKSHDLKTGKMWKKCAVSEMFKYLHVSLNWNFQRRWSSVERKKLSVEGVQ